jgi:hypothetical protein
MRNHSSSPFFEHFFIFNKKIYRESGVLCPNLLEWHGIRYCPFGGKGEKLERGGGGKGGGEGKKIKKQKERRE